MANICLDKTIGETLKYLNGQSEMPSCIKVVDFCGMPYSFGFKNSGKFEMPIEHIGLAKICYEEALKTFYTTKVNPDGSTQKVFERLSEGNHVSDCLNNLSMDIFSWYKGSNQEPLKLVQFPECLVHKPDLINYDKYCDIYSQKMDEQNVARIDVVDSAIKSAIQVYASELVASGEVSNSEAQKIKLEEEYENILALSEMYHKTSLVFQQSDNNEDLEQ